MSYLTPSRSCDIFICLSLMCDFPQWISRTHELQNRFSSNDNFIIKFKLFFPHPSYVVNVKFIKLISNTRCQGVSIVIYRIIMTDLVLHAVLHDQKNYHLLRFKFLIKLLAEMKSNGTEYSNTLK